MSDNQICVRCGSPLEVVNKENNRPHLRRWRCTNRKCLDERGCRQAFYQCPNQECGKVAVDADSVLHGEVLQGTFLYCRACESGIWLDPDPAKNKISTSSYV